MLKPTEDIRNRLTFAYRGYDLEVTRALSGWLVGMYPRTADFPISRETRFSLAMKIARLPKQKSE